MAAGNIEETAESFWEVMPGIRPDMLPAIRASHDSAKSFHEDDFVDEWIKDRRDNARLEAGLVPLKGLDGWRRESQSGNICSTTGRFFSIIGIHCRHRIDRYELEWDQPIIEQPETGILGILAKSIGGVLHFCLQAKEEPGNIGGVQLSPTVQATYSNYTGVHGGVTPLFLDLFTKPSPESVIFARMQTEDGGRFLYKSNRNMIIKAGGDIPEALPHEFIWLTQRQIARLIKRDNLVNACTRSILSSLVFGGFSEGGNTAVDELHNSAGSRPSDIWDTLQWLDDRRAATHMVSKRIGLNELREWRLDDKGFFSHCEKRFFKIVGINISSAKREVGRWSQPIIENRAPGVIGLLVRKGQSGLEILMQAKAEPGNKTAVQLAPTVQFTQENYSDSNKLKKPFLFEEFLWPVTFRMVHNSRQTEEGARFYREYNIHRILELPDGAGLSLPDDYRWLPLSHVLFLVHFGEQVNSCARSILTCLL